MNRRLSQFVTMHKFHTAQKQSKFDPLGLFGPDKVELSRELICKGSLSAAVGVILGILCSLVVNCTLVEISLSAFFSVYFGILFVVVGLIILWRISANSDPDAQSRKQHLTFFAALIVLSGVLCFVLEKNWFVGLHTLAKVPLYMVLGISVSFALTFSLVDLVNYLMGFFQASVARPLVESKAQINLVLCVAMAMGGLFGLIFGVMDVEDEVSYHIRLALLREEHYCYPIGAVLGGIAGFGNEYLRQLEDADNKRRATDFDDQI